MSILNRISRLFKADLHGILDNLEEPEMILKQAIRDMQQEIDRDETTLSTLKRQQDRLHQKRQQQSQWVTELQQQLKFCLDEDNETLAKSVIRKKLQAELSVKELSRQLKNVAETMDKKTSETEERQEKLQAVRDKLDLFSEPRHDENIVTNETGMTVSQDDVELAYLYEKQRHVQSNTGEQP